MVLEDIDAHAARFAPTPSPANSPVYTGTVPAREPSYVVEGHERLDAELAEVLGSSAHAADRAARLIGDLRAELARRGPWRLIAYRRGGTRQRALALMIDDGNRYTFSPSSNPSALAVFEPDGARMVLSIFRPDVPPEGRGLLRQHKDHRTFRHLDEADWARGAYLPVFEAAREALRLRLDDLELASPEGR